MSLSGVRPMLLTFTAPRVKSSWPRTVLFFFPRPAGGPGRCEARPSGCGIGAVGSLIATGALKTAEGPSFGGEGGGTAGSAAGCTGGAAGDGTATGAIMIALDPSAGRGTCERRIRSCTCTGTGPNARIEPASMDVGEPAGIFVVPT